MRSRYRPPVIVWQDRRTAGMCRQLSADGAGHTFRDKTGLLLDAYFSGTKISWLLDNVSELRKRAEAGEIAVGTIDSWLVYKLTGGREHLTDYTNASRTLLMNLAELRWDPSLCELTGSDSQTGSVPCVACRPISLTTCWTSTASGRLRCSTSPVTTSNSGRGSPIVSRSRPKCRSRCAPRWPRRSLTCSCAAQCSGSAATLAWARWTGRPA